MPPLGSKKADIKDDIVRAPVTLTQKQAMNRAAEREGLRLSEWMRRVLVAALPEEER